MAPGKIAADFNAIINADRQRRKNEALAQEIFSKGRRQSAPSAGSNSRKPGTGPSLASRIGVAKRTVSTTHKNATARSNLKQAVNPKPAAGNVDAEWTHDLHAVNNPSAARESQPSHRALRQQRFTRTEQLYSAFNGSASSPAVNTQFNVVGAAKASKPISIKGMAGPYIVMAKNFAQGTTADDIESAMTPVGGVCLSCRIVTETPNVIAEIIFESKEGAENVVSTFNNQNADGNLLHVFHKVGGPSSKGPVTSNSHLTPPLGPRADTAITHNYGSNRPRSDRRRDMESRGEVIDGSYGFEERMDTDDPLYSDNLVSNRGSRDRGRGINRGRGYR